MSRRLLVIASVLWLAPAAISQDKKDKTAEPSLSVAHGVVEKADKESVTVKPRAANGQFQKAVTLRVTGTSKVSVLSPQTRAGKVVFAQRDAEAKDLAAGQVIAVIYAEAGKEGPVLLSAVAEPAAGK